MPGWITFGIESWPRADVLSFGQLVFTVLGFAVAIWQLSRAATASENTTQEIKLLQSRYAANDLLVAIPVLHSLEDQLEAALKAKNQAEVQKSLAAYTRSGNEIVAVLRGRQELAGESMLVSLPSAIEATNIVRTELSKGKVADLHSLVGPVLQQIYSVSSDSSVLMAQLQRKVES